MTTNKQSQPKYIDTVTSRIARAFRWSSLLVGLGVLVLYWGVYLMLWVLLPAGGKLWLGLGMIALTAMSFPFLFRQLTAPFRRQSARWYVPTRIMANQETRATRQGLLSGQVLGGYTLLDLIEKGGMSEVYTAESGGLLLAVKVVDTNNASELLMRFEREVIMLKQARHPNVVQVFDNGVSNGYAYMVMEYIDGINLKDYIEKDAPLPLKDVVDIVEGVAAAVDHMHSLGIVHRDLKPGNIMLYWDTDDKCIPLLLDFGVAKQTSATVITLEGTVGTVEYMSPEQILEAPMVQGSSDVYALGVMVYEMLTGQLPYDGSIGAIVFGHLHGEEKDPSLVNETLPAYMSKAVCKAMSKEPEQRFLSISDFARAIGASI